MYTHWFLTKEAQDDLRTWAEEMYKAAGCEPIGNPSREITIRALMEKLYLFDSRGKPSQR